MQKNAIEVQVINFIEWIEEIYRNLYNIGNTHKQ